MRTTTTIYLCLLSGPAVLAHAARDTSGPTNGPPQASSQETGRQPKKQYTLPVKQLSDRQYPDNPDIGFRSADYGKRRYDVVSLFVAPDRHARLQLHGPAGATVEVGPFDILPFLPAAPPHVRDSEYLSYIAVINQEWNRQQVRFDRSYFHARKDDYAAKHLVRIDLARNCLNAGLWEIFLYKREKGTQQVYFHGWFDFPKGLYAALFRKKNGAPYRRYRSALENWVDPPSKTIAFGKLRRVLKEQPLAYRSLNRGFYPLVGERRKKKRNIIAPKAPKAIAHFLSDQTRFATFSPPGVYTRSSPRKTELGRFAQLTAVVGRRVRPANHDSERIELELRFSDGRRKTRFIISGLHPDKLPRLAVADHHRGYQMPMGIANHTFYQNYQEMLANPSAKNPYFALLVDDRQRFVDSHKVGIDGPLIHRDAADPQVLHLWVLSFERHALVGHYRIRLPSRLSTLQTSG